MESDVENIKVHISNTRNVAMRNIGARSRNYCYGGKAIYITNSECVPVALVKQHAKRLRHIILSFVGCPTVPCFFFPLYRYYHNCT